MIFYKSWKHLPPSPKYHIDEFVENHWMSTALFDAICKIVAPPSESAVSDGDLLGRFVGRGDQAAFTALVKRHGPMVFHVCRRLLRSTDNAEDAFQATFLVLVQKARSIGRPDSLGNWLYGVAYRTALKARATARQRQKHEHEASPWRAEAIDENSIDDLGPLVDEEVNRLPEKYRAPFVLCCLEGKTNADAARMLGCPRGTVLSRLARARSKLRARLRRRGVVPAVLGALVSGENTASAALPARLLGAAVHNAMHFASGQTSSTAQTVVLAKGVMKAMFISKLKTLAVVVVAIGAITATTAFPLYHVLANQEAGAGPSDNASARACDENVGSEEPRATPESPPFSSILIDSARDLLVQEASGGTVRGSGKSVTKEMKVTDFSKVEAGAAFHVELVKGDGFSVKITADDNLIDEVSVVKDGSTLRLGLKPHNRSFQNSHWKATIAMPSLEGIRLDAASQGTIKGFESKSFTANLGAASRLSGDIKAEKVTLAAQAASKLKLEGSAKNGALSADGASSLDLQDFVLAQAEVKLAGASKATINVTEKLDYNVSGASNLTYRGNPTIGTKVKTGAGRVKSQK
jgi:RNA polymerase sigma factor (sigma-70 family)